MADNDTPERPEPRDKTISARIPADVYDKARERAKKEQRPLSAIIRAWLTLFSEDEAPSPPVLPSETTRAKKRRKKKKRTQ